jgi:hypothetical protein
MPQQVYKQINHTAARRRREERQREQDTAWTEPTPYDTSELTAETDRMLEEIEAALGETAIEN